VLGTDYSTSFPFIASTDIPIGVLAPNNNDSLLKKDSDCSAYTMRFWLNSIKYHEPKYIEGTALVDTSCGWFIAPFPLIPILNLKPMEPPASVFDVTEVPVLVIRPTFFCSSRVDW
jgi:hypothetical protein